MKPTPVILLLFCALLTYSACKKDNHQPPPPPVPKVKTVSWLNYVYTYTYDNQGRQIRADYNAAGQKTYATYTYNDTAVISNYFDTAGKMTYQTIYKLGANGMVAAFYQAGATNDQTVIDYTPQKQLHSKTETRILPGDPNRIWSSLYYYTGANLDSIVETYNQNPPGSPATYTYYDAYYTDQINTVGNANYGQAWLGSSSANPVKLARDIGHDGTGNYPQTSYTYDYDSLGRIVKQYHMWGSSSFPAVSYTYY
ncbi:MAG: hypothetical protein Q8927_08870 [Bacteroidota bacterium]|nr:hypothetical protein [Bacteroidota bacterium]MDP4216301.1 hypothetical protein [Bacteroidota bacterium]MDP4252610.1 hypothetical protein [Bacteroidota bacterium]MDP4258475.1 hypothetical protein [Bacteroidota bacterium]